MGPYDTFSLNISSISKSVFFYFPFYSSKEVQIFIHHEVSPSVRHCYCSLSFFLLQVKKLRGRILQQLTIFNFPNFVFENYFVIYKKSFGIIIGQYLTKHLCILVPAPLLYLICINFMYLEAKMHIYVIFSANLASSKVLWWTKLVSNISTKA